MSSAPTSAARARLLPPALVVTGTAGSALMALGGLGAGATPVSGGWPDLPRGLGTVLVVVGVLLLVGAWWRARRRLDDATPGAVVATTALWSAPLLVAPPLFSRDVYSYAGQALLVAQGLDPYEVGPSAVPGDVADNVDEVWLDTPAPYGPAFLGPASVLLRVTGDDVVPAVLLLRLLAVLGVVLVALALPTLARACGVPVSRALWLGLANPLLLLHGVAGAHNDALMIGLLVSGAALAVAPAGPRFGRLVAAGALVCLAGLVKAPAFGALPFLALAVPGVRAQLRAGAALLVGAVTAGVVAHAASGLGSGWLGALEAGRARLSLFSPTTGLGTLAGTLAGDGEAVREAVLTAGVVLALALGALLLLRAARRPGPVAAVEGLGLALLAVAVLSPTVLPWYLLWAVVPLAAVARPRAAAALGAGCLVLCLATWPSGRSVVRPPLYGLPLLAAGAVAVAVWRVPDRAVGSAGRSCGAGVEL